MMSPGPKWTYLNLLGKNGRIYQWIEIANFNGATKYESSFSVFDWQHIHYIWNYCLVKVERKEE